MNIIGSIRRWFLYFVALAAFSTAHGLALEELMPLVPAGAYNPPEMADNAELAARQIDGLGMVIDKPRPAVLHKNIIKLKIPTPDSAPERKISPSFAAEAMSAYNELDNDVFAPPANFIPPPPRDVMLAKTDDPPVPIITPASRTTNLRPPGTDSGRVTALEPLSPMQTVSPASRHLPPPLPEIEPFDTMAMTPAKTAARPPAPSIPSGDIPGLVTPELLAIGNDVLTSFNAHNSTNSRNDFNDLVGFQEPYIEYRSVNSIPMYAAQQASDVFTTEPAKQYVMVSRPVAGDTLMAAASPLPELPTLGDPYISTLEPFTPPPVQSMPPPNPVAMPRPVVKSNTTFHSRAMAPVYMDTTPLPVVSAAKTIPMAREMAVHQPSPQNHYIVSHSEPLPSIAMTQTQTLSTMAAPTSVMPASPSYYSPPQPQPRSDNNSSRQSSGSGPLLLPIPPMGMQQEVVAAPQQRAQPAPRYNPPPSTRAQPGYYVGFMPDGNLPSALTPDEFAVLETQGYPEPVRPSGRRRPPAEVFAQQQTRAPEEESPPQNEPTPKKRKKVEGFTEMRGNRTAIGPPKSKNRF